MTTMLHEETTELAKLVAEVTRQKATRRDVVADTRLVNLAPASVDTATLTDDELAGRSAPLPPSKTVALLDMPTGVEEFGITRHAHQQVAETVSVPWKTYDRLLGKHPDLLHGLVNGLLSREPEKRLIRLLDGNMRAVLSDRYRPRDNAELLEHLLPVFAEFPDVQFKSCQLTETRLYVKTFLPGLAVQVTPRVGDVIRGGVIFSNSEVGSGSLYVYPYSDRLECLNGMVHTEFGQRRIHVGRRIESTEEAYELYSDETMKLDDAAFFAKCADTVRACLDAAVFEAIAGQMRDLDDIKIPGSPVDAIKIVSDRHAFTGPESDSILKFLIEGGDLSAWGYVNAITATARDTADADRQTELEIVAGRMTSDPALFRSLAAA